MITCITCITYKLRTILFSLHDTATLTFKQLRAWFLSLDNSQTEIHLEYFGPQNTSTILHGFSQSHITSSDLVDNSAVSLYSQLNGFLTTLGPHLVRYIPNKTAMLRLSAVSSLGWYHTKRYNIGCKFKKASLNP